MVVGEDEEVDTLHLPSPRWIVVDSEGDAKVVGVEE